MTRWRIAGVVGFALATFLSFPHPVGGRVVDLGLVASWLPPALLILLVRDLSPKRAARWGFLASLAAHSAVLHWIYVVTVVYGHAPVVVGCIAPVLLASYIAFFGAAFAGSYAALRDRGFGSPFTAALLWTALDHLRSFALTGFPWATLGYAQHENPWLLPLASVGGVYALSFVTALGGGALATGWVGGPGSRRTAGIALAVVVAAHGIGAALPDPEARVDRETARIAVLQGNIDQGVKWNRAWSERTLLIYEELTRQAAADGARLVVWPETAVPGAIEADPGLRVRLERLARETGAQLVVGGVGLEFEGGRRPSHYFDSAFLVDPAGRISDRYDKTHLVPFGEYVPFRSLIGFFVGAVASGIASADVSAGERPRAVVVRPDGLDFEVGVVVCYELLFPDRVRRFAVDGAEVLLGITNDAWYGRTGAPYQFLAITALRSAETGLWTARAANTGISGFIDGRGRVREQTPIFERAYRVADVPRHPEPSTATFYVRHGNVLVALCWAGAIAIGIAARSRAGSAPEVREGGG